MSVFTALIRRDLRLGLRNKSQTLLAPCFFVTAAVLFPLAIGPETAALKEAAPGLLAVCALLAALLPLDTLFRADSEDGTIDLLALSPARLGAYAAAKMGAHWLFTGLPLLVLSPVLAIMLGLPSTIFGALFAVLPAMTVLLTLIGGVGAALSLGTRQGSILLALLVLPFYIPVLIFGAGAIDLASYDISQWNRPLLFLWAMLAIALPVVPLVTGAILKGQTE